MPAITETNRSENGNATCRASGDKPSISSRVGGFRLWLLMLEGCEECLRLEAQKYHAVQVYKTALRHWQEAGRPNPGEWPDTEYLDVGLRVSPYTHKWMQEWSKQVNPAAVAVLQM